MPSAVIYDVATNFCKGFDASIDPSQYRGRADVLIFSDRTRPQTENDVKALLRNLPIKYLKKIGTLQVSEMTTPEKAQVEAAIKAAAIAQSKAGALSSINQIGSDQMLHRTLAALLRNHINPLLTLHSLPVLTLNRLYLEMQSIINSGEVDE